jgi:tetratricopeptide (TPR) repeat protein
MTVRHLALLFALASTAALFTGCVRRDAAVQIAEADEPLFREGKSLEKQGRDSEALNAFLKVIETRGLRSSPESHLEAGQLYLKHIKNPVRAMFHLESYIELMPNSKERPFVQGLLLDAKREFARTLPGRPLEDQSIRLETTAEIETLKKENEELRAELATLKGGGAALVNRGPRMFAPPPRGANTTPGVMFTLPAAQPAANAPTAGPTAGAAPFTAAPGQAAPAGSRATATKPAPTAPAAGGRTYAVKQGDGLYAIARKYDPQNASRKLREILDANRDTLPSGANTPLKPGMTLRIP